jgi:hypothetical protein
MRPAICSGVGELSSKVGSVRAASGLTPATRAAISEPWQNVAR